jgi:opacity protein-like surface antigen
VVKTEGPWKTLLFVVLSSWFFVPAAAVAQSQSSSTLSGFATGFIGRGDGGADVTESGWAPGASMAIAAENGVGTEIDLWQLRDFDPSRFAESRVTAFLLNVIGIWTDPTAMVRPYVVGGVGILRSRVCAVSCAQQVSSTALGLDAGAGTFVMWNETVGARADFRYIRYLQRQDVLPLDNDAGYFSFWRTSIGVTVSWPIR